MPITRVLTNLNSREDHWRIAGAAADVFGGLGLSDEHITTTFTVIGDDDLFVGRSTFSERFPGERFALITVSLGSHRGTDVRTSLAAAFTAALSGSVEARNVCVDFTIRDGGDVYVGGVAMGVESAGAERVDRSTNHGDVDSRLRRLLDIEWVVGSTGWHPATPLSALRDADAEWDSLAAAALAVSIETNLALSRDLNVGNDQFRKGFGIEASYADLLELVESCA